MHQMSLTSAAVLAVFFLPALCFPFDDSPSAVVQDHDPNTITRTMVSTFMTTSTITTYMAAAPSTTSDTSSAISTSSDGAPNPAVFFSPGLAASSTETPPAPSDLPPIATAVPSSSSSIPSPVSPTPQTPLAPDPSASDISSPPPAATPPASVSKHGTPPSRPQVMAYYPDWATADFPPEKIDFDRLDWIDYAFAVPDDQYSFNWDGSDDGGELLTRLVTAAHSRGKKVKVSVGGWTGSRYFSPATANDASRRKLASNILALYKQYNLDGIDIDWEYPAQQGDAANAVSPNDTANFLAFLQVLRRMLPPQARISAAAMTVPWAGPDGNSLRDMSAFAKVLDWILIMNYDTWGSSAKPGANSALNDACHNSTQSSANALSAIQIWTAAGFPANQIVLGVPSYGYISRSSATRLRTRSLPPLPSRPRARRGIDAPPLALHLNPAESVADALGFDMFLDSDSDSDSDSGDEGGDPSTDLDQLQSDVFQNGAVLVTNEDGGIENGQVQFRDMLRQGILKYIPDEDTSQDAVQDRQATRQVFAGRPIENLFTGFSNFTRRWDECSNTPFLTSGIAKQVVAYDDPQSLEMKATFAKQAGLLGVNMFDIHGDTDHWDLIDAVRRGLDLE